MNKLTKSLCVIATISFVTAISLNVSYSGIGFKESQKKIGFSVYKLFEKNASILGSDKIPVMVLLKEEADLSSASKLSTKEAKGAFVYNALTTVAQNSQKDLAQTLKAKNIPFKSLYIINAIVIDSVDEALINELSKRSDVKKIIGNPTVKITTPMTLLSSMNTLLSEETVAAVGDNITATGAEKVWNDFGTKGENIVIAGQDTGVDYKHAALKSHYRGLKEDGTFDHTYSWHDSISSPIQNGTNECGYNLSEPCDDDKHGSHTMGTMIGDDGGSNKIGMAPGAKWIACRNMDAGAGAPSSYLECFQFFLAPYPQNGNPLTDGKPEFAPHVINNSWGCPAEEGCEGREMVPALNAMEKAGIMTVVSAGNDGPGCSTIKDQPATITDLTFTVGAINHRNNKIASFSSRGPSKTDGGIGPDITAPGVSIRSSIPGGGYEGGMWSGTSMAGPHVAGAVALIWSAQPKLIGKIAETVDLLRSTATPITTSENCGGVSGTSIPNNTYGYGNLNVYEAVKKAKSL